MIQSVRCEVLCAVELSICLCHLKSSGKLANVLQGLLIGNEWYFSSLLHFVVRLELNGIYDFRCFRKISVGG